MFKCYLHDNGSMKINMNIANGGHRNVKVEISVIKLPPCQTNSFGSLKRGKFTFKNKAEKVLGMFSLY